MPILVIGTVLTHLEQWDHGQRLSEEGANLGWIRGFSALEHQQDSFRVRVSSTVSNPRVQAAEPGRRDMCHADACVKNAQGD